MNQRAMNAALKKFFSPKDAAMLNERVLKRIKRIDVEREKYSHKALEMHFGDSILPLMALYLELKEDAPEAALERTREVAEEMYFIGRKRMAFLGRFPFYYWLIQNMVSGMMKRMFPSEGWDIEWVEVSKKEVAFNMHACFYYDVLKEYDVPELTPVFCGLDDLIYDNISPHLRWQRTGTLGRGDALCDFRFINPKME